LAAEHDCHPALLVGGKPIGRQIRSLEQFPTIVIGTPGRVIDLLQRRNLSLAKLRVVVLDEADRMLDIGFRPDIERILRQCPTERQTMLLSATMPPPVERLAQRYMKNPDKVDLSGDKVTTDLVEQFYCTVDPDKKFGLLVRLLVIERPQQALVFCRTKRGADRIYRKLSQRLPDVGAIHGDLQQSERDRVMRKLRDGSLRLLVATDVVGRGIDISGISHIINYDIPEDCDDYVHRVGRTGRISSARPGRAFTFVTQDEGEELTRVEMRINHMLTAYEIPGFEAYQRARPVRYVEPEPVKPAVVENDDWSEIRIA
jgi:ATP-dependent RNA helicase DeaD